MSILSEWVGHFESPYQDQPSHDPGMRAKCPVCHEPLSDPVKTISVMSIDGERSYFFRAHKMCWEGVGSEQRDIIEGSVIDGSQ